MLEDIPHMRANIEVEKAVWAGNIKTANKNEENLIHMGEILTDGIVKHFQRSLSKQECKMHTRFVKTFLVCIFLEEDIIISNKINKEDFRIKSCRQV